MRTPSIVLTGICLSCAFGYAQPQTPPAAQTQNAPAAGTADSSGPTEVVQAAAQGMLRDLDKDRDTYRRDPAKAAVGLSHLFCGLLVNCGPLNLAPGWESCSLSSAGSSL